MTQVAEVVTMTPDWIWLAYDMPAKAKAERYKFIKKARAIGAEQHTQSVYYLPYSPQALALANELAELPGTSVTVSLTKVPDTAKAAQMHNNYDKKLQERLGYVAARLAIAEAYIGEGHLKQALRTKHKTGELLSQLTDIYEGYKPAWFGEKLQQLLGQWVDMFGGANSD